MNPTSTCSRSSTTASGISPNPLLNWQTSCYPACRRNTFSTFSSIWKKCSSCRSSKAVIKARISFLFRISCRLLEERIPLRGHDIKQAVAFGDNRISGDHECLEGLGWQQPAFDVSKEFRGHISAIFRHDLKDIQPPRPQPAQLSIRFQGTEGKVGKGLGRTVVFQIEPV